MNELRTAQLDTQSAIICSMAGFAAARNIMRPCGFQQLRERSWVVCDPPASSKLPPRTTEIVSYRVSADEVFAAAAAMKYTKYFICAFVDTADQSLPLIADFKRAGCRLMRREPLFVAPTDSLHLFPSSQISRVTTQERADAVATAARAKQILPEHLTDDNSLCRLYAAYEADDSKRERLPVGWLRSVRTIEKCSYVAGLNVVEVHRRKGLGKALMSAMLADDARLGLNWSVLTASSAGALLYPHLGYEQRGKLVLFASPKAGY